LFFKSNIKEEAVQGHKERLIGGFLLGLSTTGGLVSALHKIGREGKPLSYLDEYPELLRSMTLEQIKEAADLIPLNQLSVAAAGTFADKA
jgi:predicted Zn-dependent peptidase